MAFLSFLAGLAAVAWIVASSPEYLVESWYLYELHAGSKGREELIEKLGDVGSQRSVIPLTGVVRREDALRDAAVFALVHVFQRVPSSSRLTIVDSFFDAVQAGHTAAAQGLLRLDLDDRELGERYARYMLDAVPWVKRLAAVALARQWPRTEGVLARAFDESGAETAALFFRSVLPPGGPEEFDWRNPIRRAPGLLDFPASALARAIALRFAREHGDPIVRFIALASAMAGDTRPFTYDFDMLRDAYASDRDPVFRSAVIRLVGFLGAHSRTLDLDGMIQHEEDTALLTELLRSRQAWSCDWREKILGFEVGKGFTVDWFPRAPQMYLPAAPPELPVIHRLGEILDETRDADLRDAASALLAGIVPNRASGGDPLGSGRAQAAFRVHEWGVWQGECPGSHDDLPLFASRMRPGGKQYVSEWVREFSSATLGELPAVTFRRPVLFFYSPAPVAVDVGLDFPGGHPWAYFPDASYRTLRGPERVYPAIAKSSRGETRVPQAPWANLNTPDEYPPPSRDELDAIEAVELTTISSRERWRVPERWFERLLGRPGLGATSGAGGASSTVFVPDVRLQWRGLRVGYGEELEGEFREPESDASWWSRLREVPSVPVALRGEHEKFLFYDGMAPAPSLVDASLLGEPGTGRPRLRVTTRLPASGWLETVIGNRKVNVDAPLPGVFVVDRGTVGEARGRFYERVPMDGIGFEVDLTDLELVGEALEARLLASLRAGGLTEPESRALLDTWREEFLETPGQRVIALMPRWLYDVLLPLTIEPEPEELVRVGLVWKEVRR